MWFTHKKGLVTAIVLSLIVFSGCISVSVSPITGKKRAYGYSWAQEIQIGKENDPQIVAEFGLMEDARLTAYVTRIGEELLAESHLRRPNALPEYKNTKFTFRVLNSPVINAFALPGGYVYVTRGLLAHLNNEAQLAVVLGHEIGHVAARHGSQRGLGQQLGQAALMVGVIGASVVGVDGESVAAGAGMASQGLQLALLKYGRDDERESDKLGVEYSALNHYEAGEGAAFFGTLRRMREQSGQSIPNFMSSHPDPGEREATITRMAGEWAKTVSMTKRNEDAFLPFINGMIYGADPRDGFVKDNHFYHPNMRFGFPVPAGWQNINQTSQVVNVSAEQDAVSILSIDSESASAQAAGQAFAGQEGLTVTDQGATTVNGMKAYEVKATVTQEQSTLNLLITFVEYNNNVFRFLAYTTADKYAGYEAAFNQIAHGFNKVTASNILNVQPTTLKLVAGDGRKSFQQMLPNNLPAGATAEDFAILNQLQLSDVVSRGAKVKIPVVR